LARIVIKAAKGASNQLQEAINATLANITAMTDAACPAILGNASSVSVGLHFWPRIR